MVIFTNGGQFCRCILSDELFADEAGLADLGPPPPAPGPVTDPPLNLWAQADFQGQYAVPPLPKRLNVGGPVGPENIELNLENFDLYYFVDHKHES